jgi:hypothetical protein
VTSAPRDRIESLAREWRIRWYVALAALGLSIGLLGAAMGAPPVLTALAIILTLGVAHWRRPRVDAEVVARHLDRVFPVLEESTTLLLAPDGGLTAVERVQRGRVERAFAELPRYILLPRRPLRIIRGAAVAACILAWWISRGAGVGAALLPGRIAADPAAPPRLAAIELTVTEPAYLGGTRRRGGSDAEAPEGSTLAFEVRAEGASGVTLLTTNGDSVAAGNGVTFAAERSFLYQVLLARDTFRVRSPWHRVTVLPDRPPLLTVVRPEERTHLPSTPPWKVPVEILASDDHGIVETRLIATITTGSGEGVKFREDTIPFATRSSRGSGLSLRAELDLAALGMGPGDELYLAAQAIDGRRPEPNEGRSTTLFISIADTAMVTEGEFDGLAIDRMPDYFRSQRQIIIDTEKLLAERVRLTEAEFKRRSNDIGIDQQLLRLRYSEVAGGEEEGGAADPMGGREHAAAEPEDPNAAAVADPNARAQADLTQGQAHSHDIVENATLLAMSTKELLQRALGQMWQAELQLRTYKPDTALPYEQRALEYLEAVRQAARSYVKRVGLEPPPLEPDRKRLTGDLSGIAAPRRTATRERRDSLPAIRRVLAGARSPAALDAAAREVAALAVEEPVRHLETLRALAEWSEALRAARPCAGCETRSLAGLQGALPPAPPVAGSVAPTPAVVDRYFARVRRP